jgi:hypothetical protein
MNVSVPGMPPAVNNHNVYLTQTYVANGDPQKQWFNVWMAKYYGVKTVSIDNSIRPVHVPINKRGITWRTYQALNHLYAAVTGLLQGHAVHAATAMRTAYLQYVDPSGRQVGTEPISGNVGTTFDISHASVSGYSTLPGNPQRYRFTAAKRQTVTIFVRPQAAMHMATLRYTVRKTGRVVGTERISGQAGHAFDISHAAVRGYATEASNPDTYRFTSARVQDVTIWVRPAQQGVTLSYRNGHTQVGQQYFKARTGSVVRVVAPVGYKLASGERSHYTVPARGLGTVNVQVVRKPFMQRLLSSAALRWVLAIAAVFIIWDQWVAARQERRA